ncbi:MAG: hypothetical protein JWO71_4790 [Candidatus Acidoferrum typicum]|nr:hypothetical protein [Candidatus Acidoferrum typicum]MCU1270017.1 hypothetical protein [Acidobacteriaceae bacterium]
MGSMSGQMRKIIFWTLGVALVGAFFGSLDSYSQTWYGVLLDSRVEILIGAVIGAILGYTFSRRLRTTSK